MFPGFSPEALSFLRGLKRNNRREWFQPRKEIFEARLKAPMIQLVEAINAELLGFAPDHITDPKKAVYRIYRDTRFSADKTPYKTHVAAVFPHHGLGKQSSAGFYFHLTEKSVGIAAGSYMPPRGFTPTAAFARAAGFELLTRGRAPQAPQPSGATDQNSLTHGDELFKPTSSASFCSLISIDSSSRVAATNAGAFDARAALI